MKLKLRYFASLREQLGVGSEELTVPADVVTVAALRAHLMTRNANWTVALAPQKALRVAVNLDMAQADTRLRPGDEVAFFPPVTGG